MILSFGNPLTRDLYNGVQTRATKAFPTKLQNQIFHLLWWIHAAADVLDIRGVVPLGGQVRGADGQYSIRVNHQHSIEFHWKEPDAADVRLV